MKRQIGYYVHHHGDGHRQRALLIAKAAPGCFTLLGTGLAGRTDGISCVELADDSAGNIDSYNATGESLHYAPCDHDGIRQRIATISHWIAQQKPGLMVVDVSVEIAMLARITGTPLAYVRLSGLRHDPPHLDAFRAASAIIAPFHRDLDDPALAPWVRDKTAYFPGLSGAYRRPVTCLDTVLVVGGKGGPELDGHDLAAAAVATPGRIWRAIGRVKSVDNPPPNLAIRGWIDTADEEIAGAGVVIGHAGDGLVNAVIAAGRPFICLPQARPFDEQFAKARRLQALQAAVVIQAWPNAEDWPGLLARADSLHPAAILNLHDPDGASKAATFLRSLVH